MESVWNKDGSIWQDGSIWRGGLGPFESKSKTHKFWTKEKWFFKKEKC